MGVPRATERFLGVALLAAMGPIMLLFGVWTAEGHPGRLDKEGCHEVRTTWVSKDGRVVARAGEYHCHRGLGTGFRLDGRETLQDSDDAEGREIEGDAPERVRP